MTDIAKPARCPVSLLDLRDTMPYAAYGALREAGDILWDERLNAWVVTSYDAVRELMAQDDDVIRQNYGRTPREVLVEAGRLDPAMAAATNATSRTPFVSGPLQRSLHQWWLNMFSAQHMARHCEQVIVPVIDMLIDRFIADGKVDLVKQLTEKISVRVIAGVMGMPWRDDVFIDHCKAQIDHYQNHFNLTLAFDLDVAMRAYEAEQELTRVYCDYVERYRSGEGEGFLAQLWRGGREMFDDWNDSDMVANSHAMFFAGTETTQHMMANLLYLLLTDGALRAQIEVADEKRIAAFVEEVLRLYGTIQFRSRIATRDFEFRGVTIREGDRIVSLQSSAGRDPAHYPNADTLDLDRPRAFDHVAFGRGIHVCAGAALARREMVDLVLRVRERLKGLTLASDGPFIYSGFNLREFGPLQATFTPGSRLATAA